MKTIATLTLLALVMLSSCTKSYVAASTQRHQEIMKEVDKTDYAKIEGKNKDKVEGKRQEEYHKYANDSDKKLNHQKNQQINQKKGWDGSFGFY